MAQAVSSGCNSHDECRVTDLYKRVSVGTRAVGPREGLNAGPRRPFRGCLGITMVTRQGAERLRPRVPRLDSWGDTTLGEM
jgi:hypothetical protein